jgi:hypothetical protein
MPCPANTATSDVITNTPAISGYTDISDCQPLPGKGYNTDGTVQPCATGFWSAGLSQRTCKSCPAAHTTLSEGSTSARDCVVQPGWAISADTGLPQPCNKGFYGPGGNAADAKGACIECPAGWSTAESAESSIVDCKGGCMSTNEVMRCRSSRCACANELLDTVWCASGRHNALASSIVASSMHQHSLLAISNR